MTETYNIPGGDDEGAAVAAAVCEMVLEVFKAAMESTYADALAKHPNGKPGDMRVEVGRLFQGCAVAMARAALEGGGVVAFASMKEIAATAFDLTFTTYAMSKPQPHGHA
jgi:hypothetical protein